MLNWLSHGIKGAFEDSNGNRFLYHLFQFQAAEMLNLQKQELPFSTDSTKSYSFARIKSFEFGHKTCQSIVTE